MTLWTALGLPSLARVAIIGGGGKTSLLFQLGRSCPDAILTTTTKMMLPEHSWLRVQTLAEWRGDPGVTYLYDRIGAEGKALGLKPEDVDGLGKIARPLLFEADGSRGRPVKIHADYEPVIPSCTGQVIIVFGLQALFRPLTQETAHRSELLGPWAGQILSEEIAESLIRRMLARVPPGASVAILLNQAAPPLLEGARRLARRLSDLRVILRQHEWWELD